MVLAMVIIGFIDNYIVVIAGHIGLWQFQIVRAAMAVALIAALSRAGLGTLRPHRLWAVAVRSALITVGMLFLFWRIGIHAICTSVGRAFYLSHFYSAHYGFSSAPAHWTMADIGGSNRVCRHSAGA